MIEKIIPHPLKPIILKYDDEKKEQEFDINLVKEYVKLHDYVYNSFEKRKFLLAESKVIDELVINDDAIGMPISTSIYSLHARAEKMVEEKNTSGKEIKKLANDMMQFLPKMVVFLDTNLRPTGRKKKEFDKEYDAYTMAWWQHQKDFSEFDKLWRKLDEPATNSAIDKTSFQSDFMNFMDHYLKEYEENESWKTEIQAFLERYRESNSNDGDMFAHWDESQEFIQIIQNAEFLFDRSLSDSFIGILDAPNRPKYFFLPGSEKLKMYEGLIKSFCNPEIHTGYLSVPVSAVEAGDQCGLAEIVMTLQHYPLLIEKFLFMFEFVFEEIEGSTLVLKENDWKGDRLFMNWFNNMSNFPFLFFFIHDRDARGYFLMGDMIADGRIKSKLKDNDPKKPMITVEGEAIQILAGRLFQTCEMLLIYCHNTGFDPQLYIEGILAEFNLGFTYEQVKEEYQKKIDEGYDFRAFTADEPRI